MIKLFAFDLFGTLIDMKNVPKEEMQAYGEHIRNPQWSPLKLPDSWLRLLLFSDVETGFRRLHFDKNRPLLVTLSNAPYVWQKKFFSHMEYGGFFAGQYIDMMVPLETLSVFKPNKETYKSLFRLFPDLSPDEICMVTANKTFGDIEAAQSLGMRTCLLRGDQGLDTRDLVGLLK